MLAAAPQEDVQALRMFQLALTMIVSQQSVPPKLAIYFNSVLRQAKDLLSDPAHVSGPILPEAMQLAIDMRDVEALRSAIGDNDDLISLSVSTAGQILAGLERPVAAQH